MTGEGVSSAAQVEEGHGYLKSDVVLGRCG